MPRHLEAMAEKSLFIITPLSFFNKKENSYFLFSLRNGLYIGWYRT